MVSLKINNTECRAVEGTTILHAANSAGYSIPVLCHKEGVPHYTSCMVCMVKDTVSGNFLPACSSLVRDGLEIDTEGHDVIDIRRKSLELLLSEHRAECEAPCKIVCPAFYNIPLFNRYLSTGDFNNAKLLTALEKGKDEIHCIDCKAYCENACRRRKIDQQISIRNLKIFISGLMSEEHISLDAGISKTDERKKFSSRTGKLEPSELVEWTKECKNITRRIRLVSDIESAATEASACMHCDCRALNDCRLRDLSEEYLGKDPGSKIVNSPAVKKINHKTGLIFENAKCIKCGLCVRVCEDSISEPSLCFISRGFISIISEPLAIEFDEVLLSQSQKAVDVCPTGALTIDKDKIV
ncbi:MAG TPA: 2Fe-2S iron-sulfur cluster-binding protein [Bacteroidales bacterium]|nr:2Fe-2S iron-sulfur cluster-binding protein [Bacteroidales bacterium]